MKLTVRDRLTISNLYPTESDIKTQILVRDITQKVEMTQDEIERINLVSIKGGMNWDTRLESEPKKVDFSNLEIVFLKEQVERLEQTKKISMNILDLVLKIRDERQDKEK